MPSHPWRVVLVDDEPPARRALRALLASRPDFAVVAECAHGAAAVAACERTDPDVLFLDVQMPGLDGFGVLSALSGRRMPEVVFVTAYDQYALQAFEARAIDYLLKPFSDERFGDVLVNLTARLQDRRAGSMGTHLPELAAAFETHARRLVVRDGARTLIVPWDEIDWIQAEDYCVRLHTARGRPLVRGSLQAMAGRLDASTFIRIHRSTIVNLARVREVRPLPSGDHEVVLADGTRLRMSRTYRRGWDACVRRGIAPGA